MSRLFGWRTECTWPCNQLTLPGSLYHLWVIQQPVCHRLILVRDTPEMAPSVDVPRTDTYSQTHRVGNVIFTFTHCTENTGRGYGERNKWTDLKRQKKKGNLLGYISVIKCMWRVADNRSSSTNPRLLLLSDMSESEYGFKLYSHDTCALHLIMSALPKNG